MKHFLFITYYYPPAGGPAVQRIIRIIQHLAKMGWPSIVITVKDGEYTSLDPELAKEIPSDLKVIRTDSFEPYQLYRKFIGKQTGEKIPLAVLSSHKQATWKEKIANTIRANLFIPDARMGWFFHGVKAGLKAVQEHPGIRLVFSSGPPHTVHLIARAIAKKTGLLFVADFRDPWINIDYYHNIKRSSLTLALDRYLEGKVLSEADAVVTISPGCEKLLTGGHKNMDLNRFHIIYNGFDPDIYPEPLPDPPQDKFVITYIGNLPLTRYTPALYQAIAKLKQEDKIFPDTFQVQFYGNVDISVRNEIKQFRIEELVQFNQFVPHQQAILKVCQSHLLLLIINNTLTRNAIVTGKLFEYLASQRHILAIGPAHGDAAEILKETKSGSIFEYEDVDGIKNFLSWQYQSWLSGKWQPVLTAEIDKYNRKNQLQQMCNLFNKLTIET